MAQKDIAYEELQAALKDILPLEMYIEGVVRHVDNVADLDDKIWRSNLDVNDLNSLLTVSKQAQESIKALAPMLRKLIGAVRG